MNGGGAKTGMPESEDGEEITVNAFLPPQVPSGSVSKTERQTKIRRTGFGPCRPDPTRAGAIEGCC